MARLALCSDHGKGLIFAIVVLWISLRCVIKMGESTGRRGVLPAASQAGAGISWRAPAWLALAWLHWLTRTG
jgi:hypothetical protein